MQTDMMQDIYRKQAEVLIPKFKRRNIESYYCENRQEAKELVMSMIPAGSVITSGGSVTLQETGIMDAIQSPEYTYVPRCYSDDQKEVQAQYAR